MPQLLLESIQPPTAIQEVDGIAVAEEMGMDGAVEACSSGSCLDDLVRPLFGDVAALPRLEAVVLSSQFPGLSVKQKGTHQPILDEYYPLRIALTQNSNPISGHILQPHLYGLADPYTGFPEEPQQQVVALIGRSLDDLVCFLWGEVVG